MPALIGHYDLNEGSGSVVHNRQGRAGHGKFRGPVAWAPTLQGSGILLDGATNSVFCGPMPEMDETKGMTLLVWFKSTHPMGLRIIASAENPATGEGWRFGVDSNKLVSVLPRDTAGDDWSDGLWHLGALVILGNEAREYVDGKITRSMKLPKPVKLNAGATLAIGSLSGKDLGGFHGVIDDVKIYNAVLSAAEIGNEFKRLIKTPQNNPELEFRRNMIVKMLTPARRQADRLPGKLKQNYEKISSCLSAVPLAVRGTELRKSMRTLETLSAEAKVFRNELDKERLRRINRSADARQPLVWGATALDNIFNDQLLPDGDVSGKIRLDACRNEYEPGQFVISSLEYRGPVRIKLNPLVHESDPAARLTELSSYLCERDLCLAEYRPLLPQPEEPASAHGARNFSRSAEPRRESDAGTGKIAACLADGPYPGGCKGGDLPWQG